MEKTLPEQQLNRLARMLRPGQVISDRVELLTYQMDAALDSGYPDGLILAQTDEDVIKVIEWAKETGIPVIARGAGTGLSGGAVADTGGVILGFARMNKISELDKDSRNVMAEVGVVNQNLDEYVKQFGLYYPPDPASGRSSTIGGNVAENAGGPHCFKYGVTTNYITGMDIVSADGKRIRLGGKAFDYPEYDFSSLMAGSEGTLAVVLRIMFRLLRNPPAVKTMMAAFDTVEDAGNAVSAIISQGLIPATMEFMDQRMMGIIEDYAHAGLPIEAGAALIIEVDGYVESLGLQMDEIKETLRGFTKWDVRIAASAEEREKIWFGRKSAVGAMARLSPGYLLLDGTVPRSKLARTLTAITRVCEERNLKVAYVFHAGDGNLHPFILIDDPEDKELLKRVLDTGARVMKICVDQGGSITGEHGIGIGKRQFVHMMYNDDELAIMQDIKEVFDPQHILNPGKVFLSRQPMSKMAGKATNALSLAPASAEDASETIKTIMATGKRLYIQGGGTKKQWTDTTGEVLSTRSLDQIVEYNLDDLYVTVGAGTTIDKLQKVLAKDKMWVPIISPWPQASIGGILAANFNAPLRMKYGSLRDNLLAVQVTMPDGRIVRFGKPVVKNVAGYDLPKLFVGSQGTLGLLTEVSLKIMPIPRVRQSLFIACEDVLGGLECGKTLLQQCLAASSLLLIAGSGLVDAPFALVYSLEGIKEDVDVERKQVMQALAGLADPRNVKILDDISGSDLWAKWIGDGSTSNHHQSKASLFRVGLPVSSLYQFAHQENDRQVLAQACVDIANGFVFLFNPSDPKAIQEHAGRLGGYGTFVTGGEKSGKDSEYRPESVALMKGLKERWDKRRILNPGIFGF